MTQSNQQNSQQFFNSIKTIDNVPCYVKISQSKLVVIVIHQHLGLVQNFSQIVQEFVQSDASILIPDLYCNLQDESINQLDQFSALKLLKFSDVYMIVKKCIEYASNKGKHIILMGFSIGAALGLKLVQFFPQISLAFLFYGYPTPQNLRPQKINCPIVIFHAQKDKIKYLSDEQMFKKLQIQYKDFSHVKFERVNASHGFMNHEHPNFDQKCFKNCRKIFHEEIRSMQQQRKEPEKQQKVVKLKKKQDQGGCSIY